MKRYWLRNKNCNLTLTDACIYSHDCKRQHIFIASFIARYGLSSNEFMYIQWQREIIKATLKSRRHFCTPENGRTSENQGKREELEQTPTLFYPCFIDTVIQHLW